MKLTRILIALLFLPVLAWAQGYRNLDEAVTGLGRGFEGGDAQAIVAGISDGEKVMLAFPGLAEESGGFFGRDQASYLLEKLFKEVKPQNFEQVSAKKNSSEGQYNINANWSVERGGKNETHDLYIVLRNKDNRWTLVSIRSGSR